MIRKVMPILLFFILMLPPTRTLAVCPNSHLKSLQSKVMVISDLALIVDNAEKLLKDNHSDPLQVIHNLMEGVIGLVKVSTKDAGISIDEKLKIAMVINGFRDQVRFLIINYKKNLSEEKDPEHQKMVEGLTTILYNIMYILINPKSVGDGLANILGGLYKIISAVLADGRIDGNDWQRLIEALSDVFGLGDIDFSQVPNPVQKEL